LQQAAEQLRKRYGGAEEFLRTFNPDLQVSVAANTERAFTGTSPSLTHVRHAYTEEVLTV